MASSDEIELKRRKLCFTLIFLSFFDGVRIESEHWILISLAAFSGGSSTVPAIRACFFG
jgi:hypothetical protein